MLKRKIPANIGIGLSRQREKARCALPFATDFFLMANTIFSKGQIEQIFKRKSDSAKHFFAMLVPLLCLDAKKQKMHVFRGIFFAL